MEKSERRFRAAFFGAVGFEAIFLASRAGDYVVGQTIAVDGGVTLARG